MYLYYTLSTQISTLTLVLELLFSLIAQVAVLLITSFVASVRGSAKCFKNFMNLHLIRTDTQIIRFSLYLMYGTGTAS